jgi:hypothetical protein
MASIGLFVIRPVIGIDLGTTTWDLETTALFHRHPLFEFLRKLCAEFQPIIVSTLNSGSKILWTVSKNSGEGLLVSIRLGHRKVECMGLFAYAAYWV